MITRVSTSTEGYDPYRKGRRVVTIDKRHMELIGGHAKYATVVQPDGSYTSVELVGGEVWDAIKHWWCNLTGWCGHAVSDAASAAKDTVVKMLPEEDGEAPGNTEPPGFENASGGGGSAGTAAQAGMPASSAPEDYGGPTSPSGYPAKAPPPPLPAASLPIMQSVVNRLKAGDPTAIKSITQLAGQASTNPIAAQTLQNIAKMSFTTPTAVPPAPVPVPVTASRINVPSLSTPIYSAPVTSSIAAKTAVAAPLMSSMSFVTPSATMGSYRPTTRTIAAGGTVSDAIGDIFKLVLSPLAWTLDGTGRLTAVAGQKLEHLSRLI